MLACTKTTLSEFDFRALGHNNNMPIYAIIKAFWEQNIIHPLFIKPASIDTANKLLLTFY